MFQEVYLPKDLRLLLLHGVKSWGRGFESVVDQEFSFPLYDKVNNYLSQSWYLPVSSFVKETKFDAVIVTSTFMDAVVRTSKRSAWLKQYEFLKSSRHTKIAFPQDDYWFSEERDSFYTNNEFDAVFPVCPKPTWNDLLPGYIRAGGTTLQGQTAYVTPHIRSLRNWMKNFGDRGCDVVYRATRFPKVPNQIGDKKGELGSIFMDSLGPQTGLRLDLGIEQSDYLWGPDWYRFLSNSRATLGSSSGSSVLLRNREMFRRALRMVEENPTMSRGELESQIFPTKDRGKNFTALAPRNLEAAALGVLQLLTPGDYGGIMEKGVDYFELDSDCRNAVEAVDLLKDTDRSISIADSAYANLIENPALAFDSHLREVTQLIRQRGYFQAQSRRDSETFFMIGLQTHRRREVLFTNVLVFLDYFQTALVSLKSKSRNLARLVRTPFQPFRASRSPTPFTREGKSSE